MKHRILSLTFALFAVNNIQAQILPPSFTIVTDSECINQIESEYNPDSIEIFKVVDNNYSKIKFFVDLEPGKGWEHHCVYYSFSRFKNNSNLSYSKTFATKPNSGESYIPKSTINMADTLIAEISVASLIPEQTNSVGNLYAVILSGGGTPISNYVRYWNDCSFIYKTLRNRFRVPDSNISLLISDGSDPGLDMRLGDGTLVSSPLDLDGDNTNETILAATKNNLTATLNTLAGTMTSEDRLFFFVIDHGGRYNEHSYINLWNYETIYDQELATLLDSFDVSSMNIVMGQCYSGGFISYLTAPNRIIATACDYDQYSYATEDLRYDEFVHHWTNAVNEHDIYGHEIASDTNNNGYVSTLEAFIYAGAHDIQPESPRFSAFVPSLADSLALNFSPFVYDLYIRDNDEDLGFEPNMTTNDSWISPDVWMRNQPDGGCEHEAIQVTGTDQLLNTYVRITNRGEKDYNGDGMYLHLYWAAAATGLTIDHWEGRVNSIYHISGSPLGVRYLNDTIKAGETKTILVRWLIPQEIADSVLSTGNPFHICHLAWVTPNQSYMASIPYDPDTPTMAGVLQYRTLAQKNASFVVTNTGRPTTPLIVNNVADEDREYSIELLPSRNNPADLTRMEVGICLEKPLYEIWQKGGCSAEKILCYDAESRTLYLQGYDSKIGELRLPKDNKKQLRMICSCSVLANEDIKEEKRYEYDIVQRDLQTGQIVGGEHFSIVQKPRKGIFPAIKSLMTSEGYELEAVGVEEDADYFWLNDKGHVMAKGQTARIVPQLDDKHILLKVKAKSDGAINYAVLSLDPHLTIKEVSPNPFKTSLTITLSEPVPEGTVISMSPIGAVGSSERYKVRSGERRLTISNADCVAGIYVIVLQVNGTVVDTRSVICK